MRLRKEDERPSVSAKHQSDSRLSWHQRFPPGPVGSGRGDLASRVPTKTVGGQPACSAWMGSVGLRARPNDAFSHAPTRPLGSVRASPVICGRPCVQVPARSLPVASTGAWSPQSAVPEGAPRKSPPTGRARRPRSGPSLVPATLRHFRYSTVAPTASLDSQRDPSAPSRVDRNH